MGRHHSFLDSLKDIGHKIEHSVPDIVKTVSTVSKFTPSGVIVGVLLDPKVEKIIGGIAKSAGDDIKKVAVGAEHLAESGYKELKSVGDSFMNKLMMPLMVVGGIVVFMMLKK